MEINIIGGIDLNKGDINIFFMKISSWTRSPVTGCPEYLDTIREKSVDIS